MEPPWRGGQQVPTLSGAGGGVSEEETCAFCVGPKYKSLGFFTPGSECKPCNESSVAVGAEIPNHQQQLTSSTSLAETDT